MRFELARDLAEAGRTAEAIFEHVEAAVEFALAGDPEQVRAAYQSLHDMQPSESGELEGAIAMLDRSDLDSVRTSVAETLGKNREDEVVDEALERLLVGRAWHQAVGALYRRVAQIRRESTSRRRRP